MILVIFGINTTSDILKYQFWNISSVVYAKRNGWKHKAVGRVLSSVSVVFGTSIEARSPSFSCRLKWNNNKLCNDMFSLVFRCFHEMCQPINQLIKMQVFDFRWKKCFIRDTLRAVSLFSVVRRAKRGTRNGHARDWWRETGTLVSRVSRLRCSRARALLSLNLKKKRDCSQPTSEMRTWWCFIWCFI